ncbi:hypothetical protein JFQ72_001824 [Vibrio parahaemolyticus]|nr:hypothetical protein [Vibrio parahaemolyticus]
MNTKMSFALGLIVILAGCGGDFSVPDSQQNFTDKVSQLESKLDKARSDKNQIVTKEVEEEIKDFLKNTDRDASMWFGNVRSVGEQKEYKTISLRYKTQDYELIILDPKLSSALREIKRDDGLYFSGSLGKEKSLTLSGGITNPEFRLVPRSIKLSTDSPELIQDKDIVSDYNAKINQEIQNRKIRDLVVIECNRDTRKMLINPKTADFSMLDMNITQINSESWVYRNSVDVENAYGHEVSNQLTCIANIDSVDGNPVIKSTKVTLN